jgi:hypothetical protein
VYRDATSGLITLRQLRRYPSAKRESREHRKKNEKSKLEAQGSYEAQVKRTSINSKL